jgi:hypothetical protein
MAVISLSGGAKLERYLLGIKANVTKASKVDVGFMKNSPYPDGTSLGEVAIKNEFGVPSNNQPPRPYFRNMITKHSGEWGEQLSAFLEANDLDAQIALNKMGGVISNELKLSIHELVNPPLAPYTIAKKGFDKPLIDTAHMFQSVHHEVS